MTLGDLLELLAGAGFTYGGYLATNKAWVAVLIAATCLAYLAQGYAADPIPGRRPRTASRDIKTPRPGQKPVTLGDRLTGTWVRVRIFGNRIRTRLLKPFRHESQLSPVTEPAPVPTEALEPSVSTED
jgi:hypothetical protein